MAEIQPGTGPGRTGYVIALVVFLIGLVGAVALGAVFFFGLIGIGDNLQRVVGPGSEEVELDETGTYTVFYEYQSQIDGVDFNAGQEIPHVDIEVERVSDGTQIDVSRTRGETSYNLRNHAGESIRQFSIDEPGMYRISVSYADGSEEPEIVLALGEGIGRGILTSIGAFLGGGLLFCLLTVSAIVIAGITLWRRHQAGKYQDTAQSGV